MNKKYSFAINPNYEIYKCIVVEESKLFNLEKDIIEKNRMCKNCPKDIFDNILPRFLIGKGTYKYD